MNPRRHAIVDLVAVWLAMFGVWPFADPGHDWPWSLATTLDLILHWSGFAVIGWRWKLVPR